MLRLAETTARYLYQKAFYSPHWRVGWRVVGEQDLWDTRTLEGTQWNTLKDPGYRFYADPFPISYQGKTVLFVEEYDHVKQKGLISAMEFGDHGPIGPMEPVLEERWHLSYPFLLEQEGTLFMIPETSQRNEVALYRCETFPNSWKREHVLIRDIGASDSTIIHHEELFWIFTAVEYGTNVALCLFFSRELVGPWAPHPQNPVLIDSAAARSGGSMVRRGNRLWRPVQDCTTRYGAALGMAEVLRLDVRGFEQRVQAVLAPCRSWRGRRLHTINRAGHFEFIDGSANSLKLLAGIRMSGRSDRVAVGN